MVASNASCMLIVGVAELLHKIQAMTIYRTTQPSLGTTAIEHSPKQDDKRPIDPNSATIPAKSSIHFDRELSASHLLA